MIPFKEKGFVYLVYEYETGTKYVPTKHKLEIGGPCVIVGSAIERTEQFLKELKEIENGKD